MIGVEDARLLRVAELDLVAPRAERRHQTVAPPEALAGDHERGDVLQRVGVGAGAGGVRGLVAFPVPEKRRHRHAGIARVPRAVIGRRNVVPARELVLPALGGGGVGDRRVRVIDQDLVAPAPQPVLCRVLGQSGDPVAAEPAVGATDVRGEARAPDLVVRENPVLEPDRLEIQTSREGVGHRAGRAVGPRQGEVGIGAEVRPAHCHAVGLHVRAVAEVGELEHQAARQPLLHRDLPVQEGLVAHTARSGEIEVVGRDGGRQQRLHPVAAGALELALQVVDDPILLAEGEAVVGRAEATGPGRSGRAVDHRPAAIPPRGDLVGRVPADREAVVHVALLHRHVDGGIAERLIRDGRRPARRVIEVPVAPALVVLVEAEQSQGDLPRHQHLVVVGLVALVAPRTEHRLERRARALEIGPLAR